MVKVTEGKVIGAWEDGTPALISNRYGRGECVFITARNLGVSYKGSGGYPPWNMLPRIKEFDSGLTEYLAAVVCRALEKQGEQLLFQVANCPRSVEVTLRTQEDKNRMLLHFLNYDYTKKSLIRKITESVSFL